MELNKKWIAVITLALFLGISLFPFSGKNYSYAMKASDFTDVPADYWGYPYIDFSADNGIINGYPSYDGTYQFRPENSVTKEESVAMIYRALLAVNQLKSEEDFSGEYTELFQTDRIAEWAWKFVSYGLKYGWISESELSEFTDENGHGIAAPRQQVAVWTAKAMNRNLSPAYSLIYVDKDSISGENLPYIDLLYRQGIMQGDDTKMFHPESGIKRSEFAAICNRVYDLASSGAYSVDREVQSYRGTIVSVDTYNNKIMMTQSDGTGRVIQINPKTQIVINGKVNYNGLGSISTGSTAVVAWGAFYGTDQNNESSDSVLQLIIETKLQTRTGLLSGIEKIDSETSLLKIENGDGDVIYYIQDKNSQTDGNLRKGKVVTFIADGIKILEIK